MPSRQLADKSDIAHIHKTKITPERADFIRDQYDKWKEEESNLPFEGLILDLRHQTGFSEYVVNITIKAYQNDFWKMRHTSGGQKFHLLTEEMKTYLKETEYDHLWSFRVKFNKKFRMSTLTPLHEQTLKKYREKLLKKES